MRGVAYGRLAVWRVVVVTCAALLLPSLALAVGFGRQHGDQQLGRPFYAEIPVFSADGLRADCLRLRPLDSDPTSFVGPATIAIEGHVNARRITISGAAPLRVPYVSFVLEARCDAPFGKEFMFLVSPGAAANGSDPVRAAPAMPVEGPANVVTAALSAMPAGKGGPVLAGGGGAAVAGNGEFQTLPVSTTLNAIARQMFPDDRDARDQFRAAISRANPDLFPQSGPVGSIVLAAGQKIRVPDGVAWPTRPARVAPPLVRNDAPARPKNDRLTLGRVDNAKLDALGAALANLEGGMAERDRVQGELVTAAAQTVQSIMEIRKAQEAQIANLERVSNSLAETIRAMEKDRADRIDFADLALLVAALVVGAAVLVWINHRLAMQRLGIGAQAFVAAGAPGLGPFDGVVPPSAAVPQSPSNTAPAPAPAMPATAVPAVDAPLPPLRVAPAAVEPTMVAVEPPPARTVRDEPAPIEFERPAAAAGRTPAPPPPAATIDFHDGQPGSAIIELADLMIAMGMPRNGVMSLIQHLDETQSNDPVEWMKLMTTARALHLENDDVVRPKIAEFFTKFNIRLDDKDPRTSVESFPHVMRMVTRAWQDGTAVSEITSLLHDDRQGERAGFPERVAADLIFLLLIAKERFADAQ